MEMTHLSAKKRPWALVLGICFLIFGALLLLCIPVSFYIITLILFSTLGSLLVLLGVVFLAISGGAGYKSASKPLTEPALRPRRRPGETDGPKFRSR